MIAPKLRDLRPERKQFNPWKHFDGLQVAAFMREVSGSLLYRSMYFRYQGRYKTDHIEYLPDANVVEARTVWLRCGGDKESGVELTFAQLHHTEYPNGPYALDVWLPSEERLAATRLDEADLFLYILARHYSRVAGDCYRHLPKHVALPEHIQTHSAYVEAAGRIVRLSPTKLRWKALREMQVDVELLDEEIQTLVVESRLIDS
jgi:hypothetical protein